MANLCLVSYRYGATFIWSQFYRHFANVSQIFTLFLAPFFPQSLREILRGSSAAKCCTMFIICLLTVCLPFADIWQRTVDLLGLFLLKTCLLLLKMKIMRSCGLQNNDLKNILNLCGAERKLDLYFSVGMSLQANVSYYTSNPFLI